MTMHGGYYYSGGWPRRSRRARLRREMNHFVHSAPQSGDSAGRTWDVGAVSVPNSPLDQRWCGGHQLRPGRRLRRAVQCRRGDHRCRPFARRVATMLPLPGECESHALPHSLWGVGGQVVRLGVIVRCSRGHRRRRTVQGSRHHACHSATASTAHLDRPTAHSLHPHTHQRSLVHFPRFERRSADYEQVVLCPGWGWRGRRRRDSPGHW